jgi:metal-responsive CopG/Arc/MetJ family transcriptional regulator
MEEGAMKTVQMTLDEDLLRTVDQVVKKLRTTRSSFTREALRAAIKRGRVQELEQKQREGYRLKPVKTHEFRDWENEQVWVEP